MNSLSERFSKSHSIGRIFFEPVVLFTAARYLGFGLLFIRGILLAKFLGPYLLGVWGFLMLLRRYLGYSGLGFEYAINVELTTDAVKDVARQNRAIGSALFTTIIIGLVLIIIGGGISALSIPIFTKYSFYQYAFFLAVIVALVNVQALLKNVYRVQMKLTRIVIGELLVAMLPLIILFFFEGEELIEAMLITLAVSGFLAVLIFIVRAPIKLGLSFDSGLIKHLLILGLPLLIYNVTYFLIVGAGRTIVSTYYPVEVMGYYTLASSVAAAILLGLSAAAWLAFPQILRKTRKDVPDDQVFRTVGNVNDIYGTSVFLVVLLISIALPLLYVFLPQYKPVATTLNILLLTQAILSLSFGYNCVAIARHQQLKVAGISIIAVVVVLILGLTFANLGFEVELIALSVMAGAFTYSVLQAMLGSRMLVLPEGTTVKWFNLLPPGYILAAVIFLAGSLLGNPILGGLIALAVFLISSRKKLVKIWVFAVNRSF